MSGGTRQAELDRSAYVFKSISETQGHHAALMFLVDSGYSIQDIREIAERLKPKPLVFVCPNCKSDRDLSQIGNKEACNHCGHYGISQSSDLIDLSERNESGQTLGEAILSHEPNWVKRLKEGKE